MCMKDPHGGKINILRNYNYKVKVTTKIYKKKFTTISNLSITSYMPPTIYIYIYMIHVWGGE